MVRYYELSVPIMAPPGDVFAFVDDQSRLSSHMSQSSLMMGGGQMEIATDAGRGQEIGSQMRLGGKVFGMRLSLEQVVTEREPPRHKVWETIGTPHLVVIGSYRMGFDIAPHGNGSMLRVFIDYDLPTNPTARWLGYVFGGMYAKWCVTQMLESARQHFAAG